MQDAEAHRAILEEMFGGATKAEKAVGSLNQTLAILRGGGAIAGVTILARILGNASEKAIELRDAFQAGKASAADVVDQIAKSLPLLGDVLTLAENISDLISGANANGPPGMDPAKQREFADEVQRTADALRVIQAPEGQRAQVEAAVQFEAELRRIAEQAKEMRAALRNDDIVDDFVRNATKLANLEIQESLGKPQRDELKKGMEEVQRLIAETRTPMERYLDEMNRIRHLFDITGGSADDLAKVLTKLHDEIMGTSKARDAFQGLREKVEDLGTTETERLIQSIRDVGKAAGQSVDEIDRMVAAVQQFDKEQQEAAESKSMKDWVDGLKEGIKTPIEKMQNFIDKLQKARKMGLVDKDEFRKIIDEQEKLLGLVDDTQDSLTGFKAPEAAERGSAEAFRAEAMFASPLNGILDKEKEAQKQRNEQIRELREIRRNTDNLDFDVRENP